MSVLFFWAKIVDEIVNTNSIIIFLEISCLFFKIAVFKITITLQCMVDSLILVHQTFLVDKTILFEVDLQ